MAIESQQESSGNGLPPDVRRGSASPLAKLSEGYAPRSGLPQRIWAEGRTRGTARFPFPVNGKAKRCRTSGGKPLRDFRGKAVLCDQKNASPECRRGVLFCATCVG